MNWLTRRGTALSGIASTENSNARGSLNQKKDGGAESARRNAALRLRHRDLLRKGNGNHRETGLSRKNVPHYQNKSYDKHWGPVKSKARIPKSKKGRGPRREITVWKANQLR